MRGTDGTTIWSYYLGVSITSVFPVIALADLDPLSSGLEIVATSLHTPTSVISSSGSLLWQMSPVTRQRSLSVGDVDSDECVEIVAVGKGTPMVAVVDAASNDGACGVLGFEDELSTLEGLIPTSYGTVEIYDIRGALIFKGNYDDFEHQRAGFYFIKVGNKVRKMLIH